MTRLDLREATLAGFSMGGGEVARYIGRYGRTAWRGRRCSARCRPSLLKTDDNPDGAPQRCSTGCWPA
jgi:peroxiredoxin